MSRVSNEDLVSALRTLQLHPGTYHHAVLDAYPKLLKTCPQEELPKLKEAFIFLSKNQTLLKRLAWDTARGVLEDSLVGHSYFCARSYQFDWLLEFSSGFWLVAETIRSDETEAVHIALKGAGPTVLDCAADHVVESCAVLGNCGREVVSIELTDDGDLVLNFEGERRMWLSHAEGNVDGWDWCLKRAGADSDKEWLVGYCPDGILVNGEAVANERRVELDVHEDPDDHRPCRGPQRTPRTPKRSEGR